MSQLLNQTVYKIKQNQRKRTAQAKTRGEVSGGGRKPWKQKGTGRARAGSNRSPLWRGGGKIFGPRAGGHTLKQNKKELEQSWQQIYQSFGKNLKILTDQQVETLDGKTKSGQKLLQSLELADSRILIILDLSEQKLNLSLRNLANVKVGFSGQINPLDLLKAKTVLVSPKNSKLIPLKK